jgi:hypothetical protein
MQAQPADVATQPGEAGTKNSPGISKSEVRTEAAGRQSANPKHCILAHLNLFRVSSFEFRASGLNLALFAQDFASKRLSRAPLIPH